MRFNKRVWMFVIGAVAALTIGGGAGATVTVNSDGTGFIGKGDVQAAFGWNNAQFQRNAAAVTFTLANELDEVQRCWQWQNGETVGFWFRYRTFDEDQLYTYQVQKKHQITGFVLTGIDTSSFSLHDDPWQFGPLASGCLDSNGQLVGNTIDENGNGWSTEDIVQPLSTLAFYVNYGGTRVELATLVP
jgi:hypothetical protein